MKTNHNSLYRFHGDITYLQKSQHYVNFLDSNMVSLPSIKQRNRDDDHDGQHQQCYVVKG